MIGETVGHYRIVSKLGAGGMGEVYLADDTRLHRQVALKFLPVAVSGDAEVLERFRREARAAAALDHPNIITVYEIGEHKGRAFIAMSYVEGKLLSDTIARGDLSIDRALDITMQICDGLSRAHRAGIVHRDMKPDNVALDGHGNVKILDFGLAKLGDVTRLTKEDSTVGTLYYMSPEQARGDDVDARTDLFSVGAMLYEMITGRRAFQGDHAAAVHYSIANEEPHPMSRYNREVTPKLERIVDKLLAKDPGARYHNAEDVMVDLRALRAESDSRAGTSAPARRVRSGGPGKVWMWAGLAAAVVIAAIVVFRPFGGGGGGSGDTRPMVVVLPFENLGSPDDEYFADGITDEITSRLATITGLGVISRTSAMRYKNAGKTVDEIARELGVTHVLEGTIRWDKSGGTEIVRITPQLIRASDDTHLWAENYERELHRIFEVQADIAAHIAEEMEVNMLAKDRRIIEAVPTQNTEAYTYYLRGREYAMTGSALTTGDVDLAIEMLTRSVELDPGFSEAWAALAIVNANYYHNGHDRTPRRLAMAREAAERAIELGPDVAEARLAMALYYYWGLKDYDNALTWLEKAAEIRSGNMETVQSFGWVLRRLGRYEEAIEYLEESLALDPKDMGSMIGLVETNAFLGRMDKSDEFAQQIIALYPDSYIGYRYRVWNGLFRGDLEICEETIASYKGPRDDMIPSIIELSIATDDFDTPFEFLEDDPGYIYTNEMVVYPNRLLVALLHVAKGDSAAAQPHFAAALDTLNALVEQRPDDHRLYSSIGLSLAGLGQTEEAVAIGRKSLELYPLSKDRYAGTWRLVEMAKVYALAGYRKEAIEQLDQLLSVPSQQSVHTIMQQPLFDSLHDDPDFQMMIRKHGGSA